ncbi:autotransporter-associated beta strand repeat-containing protein [Erythrobacter colymbi]|uniref:autotransporter-associated beta strand repeat-containing protein n=1 Tax=Erythrobacter colymbi TaxID=1161202 RepID=UPI000A3A496E|nr:autotransporter-associated beta strand repeat-containing protein [Erythrobacter colymbi]
MSVTRRTNTRRHLAHAALMASASFLSLTFASEAQAQCVTNNTDPVGNITTDGTVVTCSGTASGTFISANADRVQVEVASGATVNGGSVIFAIGDQNQILVRSGAAFDASTIYLQGAGGLVDIAGSSTAAGITVEGAGSNLRIAQGASVSIMPTNLSVFNVTGGINVIDLNGTLTGSSANGGYLIGGNDGSQRLNVRGSLVVQSDGLAANLGDGNDDITIFDGASITGGTGTNIVFTGGAGFDQMRIEGSGISQYSTTAFERLVIDAGPGGFRGINGTHVNVTDFRVVSGAARVSNPQSLGVSNSDVTIFQGATLIIAGTSNQVYDNNFAGSGTLSLNAANTVSLFGGDWSNFTGTFVIDQLNTALFTAAGVGGTGTIQNFGTIEFGDFTIAAGIIGTGRVIKDGPGNGYLTGINTFSGGLAIEGGGGLEVYTVASLGTGDITSSTQGNFLAVNIAANETLANDIGGALRLVKAGTGVLDLTGTNTYSGGTVITSGAIRVDDFARLGTGQVLANAGGSLILSYSGAGQLLQTTPFLIGDGSFIKEGSGDVVINAANTYTGGTTIRAGRLGLNNGGALGTGAIQIDAGAELGIGGIILNNNLTGTGLVRKTANNTAELYGNNTGFTGTLRVEDGDILVTNGNALGSGTLEIGTGTVVYINATADSTMAAGLAGDGTFEKNGTGRVTLTGNGSQFGGAIAIQNGTLQIAGDQNIGTSAGGVFINTLGTLQLDTAGSTNLASVVYGSGKVIKTGTGTVFMTGANTYSGGTDIQQGAIRVTNVGVLGTGAITVQAGAALDLAIAGAQTLAQNVTGAGILRKSDAGDLTLLSNGLTGGVDITGGRVIIGTAAALGGGPVTTASGTRLVFDTAGTETIGNTISGGGGLTKTGTGVLVIQNANSYSGGTLITAGRLGLNNGQGLGTGTVTVQQGAILSIGGVTVANAIFGAGKVIKTANNTGTLTGNNAYSGGTEVQQGALRVLTPASLGTGGVQLGSGTQLIVDYSGATNVAMSNVLSGSGALVKDGSGTVVINNAGNSHSGGTTINAGRLGLNFGDGLGSGGVTIASGAELGIGAISLANNVSGAGRIVKTSGGAAFLTGTNTHTGGIDIQGGSVGVSGNAALGTGTVSIASGASLDYTNAAAATFANGLSGAGTFNKLGAGQLTFANAFTLGALNAQAGRTRINTVATTNVTVASGATLDGTGRIIGNLVNNGTVAPGNSIGTLTVQGNYTHNAGSVLEIEFDANGNIDLLDVTGNAVLNGGTIRFVGIGGAEGQGGTFLRTGGTLTGTFSTVETVGALLPLSVFYQSNAALMAPSVLTARPSTFNAQNLAAADTAFGFIDAIGLVDARHGRGNRLWMSGFGAWGNRSASGTTLAYDHETRGISGGVNVDLGDGFTLGASAGWADGSITLGSNGGGGDQETVLGSVGLRYQTGDLAFGSGIVLGNVDQATLRNVSFNGFSGSVDGATESSLFAMFFEAGAGLGASAGWNFEANARASVVRQEQDAYTESGTSPLRLKLGALATETWEGQARLTATKRLWDASGGQEEDSAGLDLRLDLGGRYLLLDGDREIPVTFAVSNAGVVLQGDTRDTVQGIGGASLVYTTGSGARFSLGYRGEIGKTDRHAVEAGVSIAF